MIYQDLQGNLPKPTIFTETHQMLLPCSVLTKVRQASPAPCHHSWGQLLGLGGHLGGPSHLQGWQRPHAWDSIMVSALARMVWIKTGFDKMLWNQSQPKAKAHGSGPVWIPSAVMKQIPRSHSPATLIPTTPRCCSHVDHLGLLQH